MFAFSFQSVLICVDVISIGCSENKKYDHPDFHYSNSGLIWSGDDHQTLFHLQQTTLSLLNVTDIPDHPV